MPWNLAVNSNRYWYGVAEDSWRNRRKRRSARFAVPCLSEVPRVDAAPSPTSPWDNSGVQPAPSQMDLDAAVGEESKYHLVFGPVVDPDARF